jgi:hypothetical protein
MITLDYSFEPRELDKLNNVDIKNLSATDLDYYYFCGSIEFRVDDASFDAPWKWIPVFDFGIRLNEILSRLEHGKEAKFEFTESEASITFLRNAENVLIEANYVSASALAPFQELRIVAREFLRRVVSDLLSRFPMLSGNSVFKERIKSVGRDA